MISEQDLCSLHQVSVQDLHKRSPVKIFVQDFYKSSVGKISVRGLLVRSFDQDLHCKSLAKISVQAPYKRSLGKISVWALDMHMDMSQEPFDARIFQENCRAPEVSRTFCASQRNRNAHGHVTRAILCGNMQGKCWRLRVPPSMNTGPYCFVKNGGKRYLFGAGMIF